MVNGSKLSEVWSKKYPDIRVVKNIKSGKEADCFLVQTKEKLYCLKYYKDRSLSTTAGNNVYLAGKWFRSPSQKKSVDKGNKFGKDLIRKLWTKREFYMLKKFHGLGANVPEVFDFNNNSILMEYLGDASLPAPLLKDARLDEKQSKEVFTRIIDSIKTFYKCGIVQWMSVAWNPLLLNLRNIYDTLKPIIPIDSLGSKYLNSYPVALPLVE